VLQILCPSAHSYPPQPLSAAVSGLCPAGLDLLARLLAFNPDERLTAEQAMRHAYFDDLDPAIRVFD
jgi:cyclin-dependent kinase 2